MPPVAATRPLTLAQILSIFIALSAFGAVLSVLFALGRINQEVARDGIIPFAATIASTSSFGTPLGGIALHWAACVAIVVAAPPGDAYNLIINSKARALPSFSALTQPLESSRILWPLSIWRYLEV